MVRGVRNKGRAGVECIRRAHRPAAPSPILLVSSFPFSSSRAALSFSRYLCPPLVFSLTNPRHHQPCTSRYDHLDVNSFIGNELQRRRVVGITSTNALCAEPTEGIPEEDDAGMVTF